LAFYPKIEKKKKEREKGKGGREEERYE